MDHSPLAERMHYSKNTYPGTVMYNKMLQKQVRLYFGDGPLPGKYAGFLMVVSEAYDRYEKERKMLLHSIERSSEEMIALNDSLRKETHELKKICSEVKTLFENIEEVFFSVDMVNYKVNQVSAACEKVYGYKPEEFMSDTGLWKKVVHPDDRHLLAGNEHALAKGKHMSYRYRIIHKDKSIRWIESKIIPSFDGDGRLLRIDGVVRDITEKKIAEERIINAERLYSEAQQLGKVGSWNADRQKNEVLWSEGFRDIVGVDKNFEPDFENGMFVFHPDDREYVLEEMKQAAATGKTIKITYRIVRANDGKVRTVQSVIRPVKDNDGQLLRIYGMTQDITERWEAEQKVEQYNMLMYQISHDLRGPLNSAKNYIYLALKRVKDATAVNYLTKIHDSYNGMEQRVLSLLDLQRLNRSEPYLERICVNTLIKDIIRSIDSIKGFNEVKITMDIKVDNKFCSDKQFLHSIIYNLLSNAITHRKNMPGVLVHISAYVENERVVINVADNGPGIPHAIGDKIFDRFVKGNTSANGTGLGLYIVKSLVEKLKGEIDFESEEEKGTTFTVNLPLVTDYNHCKTGQQ